MCPRAHTAAPHNRIMYYGGIEYGEMAQGEDVWVMKQVLRTKTNTRMHTQMNKHREYSQTLYLYTNRLAHCDPDTHTQRLWLNSPAFYSTLLTLKTHTHTQVWALSAAKTQNHRLRPSGLLLYIFSLYIQSTLLSIS